MEIKIPSNKYEFPLAALLGLVLAVILGLIIQNYLQDRSSPYFYLNLVALFVWLIYVVTMTSLAFLNYFRRLIDDKAVLTIDDDGIHDKLSLLSCGDIPWSVITRSEIRYKFRQKLLVVSVRDPEQFLARKNFILRKISRRLVKRIGTPVVISQKTIAYDIDELHTIICKHLQQP
jgi:hypothetical protein